MRFWRFSFSRLFEITRSIKFLRELVFLHCQENQSILFFLGYFGDIDPLIGLFQRIDFGLTILQNIHTLSICKMLSVEEPIQPPSGLHAHQWIVWFFIFEQYKCRGGSPGSSTWIGARNFFPPPHLQYQKYCNFTTGHYRITWWTTLPPRTAQPQRPCRFQAVASPPHG